uniref:(northern house mosquito) hypothetical protein n=1 Tax=Culex pipiens TaxID=7175 RepID=A0A8D8FGP5_CULPI
MFKELNGLGERLVNVQRSLSFRTLPAAFLDQHLERIRCDVLIGRSQRDRVGAQHQLKEVRLVRHERTAGALTIGILEVTAWSRRIDGNQPTTWLRSLDNDNG